MEYDEALGDALDLSTWTEQIGITSLKGPICPYCTHPIKRDCCFANGRGLCSICNKRFRWMQVETPIGYGISLWQLERKPAAEKGD